LRKSWLRVFKELEKVTAELAEKGTSAFPEVQYNQLSQLSPEHKQRLKDETVRGRQQAAYFRSEVFG
jgi:hypothetical protein